MAAPFSLTKPWYEQMIHFPYFPQLSFGKKKDDSKCKYSDLPFHLEIARNAIARPEFKTATCFDFVNKVLEEGLPRSHKNELAALHQTIQTAIPKEHRYHTIIPYHYALIASFLKHHRTQAENLQSVLLQDSRPGDVFVYINPLYNPNSLSRKPTAPSGTHVAIIDSIQKDENDKSYQIRSIDASARRLMRYVNAETTEKRPLKDSNVGYSFFKVSATLNPNFWKCQIPEYENSLKKIHILRFL
jgi:hypothetical protein